MGGDSIKNLSKSERRIKEMSYAADEDMKNQTRMQGLVDGLQDKIKSYKDGKSRDGAIRAEVLTPKPAKKQQDIMDGIRLNKYISNSGICSRREADTYIATGLVSVNGKIINEMGYKVKLEDDVRFDGRRLNPEPMSYVLLNKPK